MSEFRPEISHYTYRVTWSADDQEFVATRAEFPSLSWLATSQIEALQGLQEMLREVIADMAEQELAIHAAEEGMSLNQYVLRKLSAA
ncbi:toxin-antitoxin system HicB family antitoxin [Micromonospora tulbaghiae]|uniref:toxin-antitoxin system HicB family antitoxin n=1 Tax=Micromonospora tulbaghiae TaxID=479978 RepID=UPI0033CAB858